jgi:hypothetical protein
VAENLPGKHDVLSSNIYSAPPTKKKKRNYLGSSSQTHRNLLNGERNVFLLEGGGQVSLHLGSPMCLKYPAIKRFFYQARKEKKKRKNQIP